MKNHFFICYWGNKRMEVEEIYKYLDFDNIKYIIEPFCGSSAVSYYISTQQPKKYIYVLNDIDKNLIKLYKIAQDEIKYNFFICMYELLWSSCKDNNKTKYNELTKNDDVICWFLKNKFCNIRPGLYPVNKSGRNIKTIKDLYNKPIINFLRNEKIIFYNEDAYNIIMKYNKSNCLFFCDPPYLLTCNSTYNSGTLETKDYNIYKELLFNKEQFKTNLYFVLEYMWVIEGLFKNNVKHKYKKKYTGNNKKIVYHCILKFQ